MINFELIFKAAENYKPQMSKFLRDLITLPSESAEEGKVIQRIKKEMENVGFDKIEIDPMGNILGYIGHGKHLIAMDAHIDTVGVGNMKLWDYDPYTGYEDDEIILGRGASDQTGGMASMVYAGKIIKDLKLEDDYTLVVVGSVQEEDCSHPFLGKGSLAVSEIFYTSPSRCAVADSCWISVDRRLTAGEDKDYALSQIRNLPSVKAVGADVSMYEYERASYTGLVYPTESYFPTWFIEEDHPVCGTLLESYKGLFNNEPLLDKWTFSTNGVSIMGKYGIPCIGFGPGHEEQAHAPNEKTWKSEMVKAAAMYAVIPLLFTKKYSIKMPQITENLAE